MTDEHNSALSNLKGFVSRKLFFSVLVFVSSCFLLYHSKLSDGAFETISISVIAAYLTSNVATRYTAGRCKFVAETDIHASRTNETE